MDDHKAFSNGDDGRDVFSNEDKIADQNASNDESNSDLQDPVRDFTAAEAAQKAAEDSVEDSSAVVQAGDDTSIESTDTAAGQETPAGEAGQAADGDEEGTMGQEIDPIEEFLQQRKRRIMIGLAIVGAAIAFLLAGWAYKNLVMNPAPDDHIYARNAAFLLIPNEEPEHIYLQIAGQEKEVCLKNVIPGSVVYLKKTDSLLAVAKNGDLLMKKPGVREVRLSTKTIPGSVIVSADETSLLFLRNEDTDPVQRQGELYLLNLEGVNDKEKISSRVYMGDYDISPDGEKILYIAVGDLYLAEGRQKTKIGSEAVSFHCSRSFETIAFVNTEQELFVRSLAADYNDKIAAAESGLIIRDVKISDRGDHVTYIENYDVRKKSGELYLQKGAEKILLASDVSHYDVSFADQKAIYLNDENELFSMEFNKEKKTRLGSNIDTFAMEGARVIFIGKNGDMYTCDGTRNKVRIASDVTDWKPAGKMAVYMNSDSSLLCTDFKGSREKLGNNVAAFEVVPAKTARHTIVYYNEDKELYVKKEGQQPLKISDKIDDYSKIYLLDKIFYERLLGLQDIHGVWHEGEGGGIIEFTRDGLCRYINDGIVTMESRIRLDNATPDEVDVFTDPVTDPIIDGDGSAADYHLKAADADHLIINGLSYRKITAEEFKKLITKAINGKLQDLDSGLAIADKYESIRENYMTLVDQLDNGEISWYYFVNTIDDARSERIGLLNQARELQNSSYDPNLHEQLVKALTYAVNYCEACYFAGDSYSDYMQESYLNDASNYVTLLQKSMDDYRSIIKKEQETLKRALPAE